MHRVKGTRRRWISPIAVGLLAIVLVIASARAVRDTLARPHLDERLFAPPTRVYARPLVIHLDRRLDAAALERGLRRLAYRETDRRPIEAGHYRREFRRWVIGHRPFRHPGGLDPGGTAIVRVGFGDRVTGIETPDGTSLPYLALEPELLGTLVGPDGVDRTPVPLSDVPDHLIEAILTTEDQRFFQHSGLDLRRIAGAAWANLRSGRVVQGGSTLTQQLIKNLYLSSRRSPLRKLREAVMAVVLERRHTKQEILAAYLNHIYLGQDGAWAIHGVGRAAEYYFGTDVTRLDLSQAALLAALIRGPSLYSPFRDREAARQRRNLVLDLMREQGLVTDVEHRDARAAGIELRTPAPGLQSARYFLDYVESRLREAPEIEAPTRGAAIFTTLDLALQRRAETAVREGLQRLENEAPYLARPESPLQAALVALDPRTGEVLAMVGGRDYRESQFNRAVAARRQPGSAFKPVVALAALSRARQEPDRRPFTLASVLEDAPLVVNTPVGDWAPTNYDGRFRGDVTLREALERSLNVPFARLGRAVGPARIAAAGERLGIESPLHRVPSLALGASEVTPLELTRAYAVLAGGGYRAETRTVLATLRSDDPEPSSTRPTGEWVYEPAEVYLVTSALRGAVERGTGRGLRRMGYRGPVAAKSGTSDDFRDAWFVGYTPSLAIGVWVGYDDGRTIGLPGARAALPIFGEFLIATVGRDGEREPYGGADFAPPDGLVITEVDPGTGLRAGLGCRGRPEIFLEGTAPERSCSSWSWPPTGYRSSSERIRPDTDREFGRLLERLREMLGIRE